MSNMGKPVAEFMISSKFLMQKNMAIEKVNEVTNPIPTVDKTALGTSRSDEQFLHLNE